MAHDKNEGIFLWMLEQDRQKNRLRVVEEMNRNSEVPSWSISGDSPGVFEEVGGDGGLRSAVDETSDLERLLKEKETLEEESRRLDEERKRLGLRERALLERLVQEIKKKNDEKKRVIMLLQAQVAGLESQLGIGELSQEMEEREMLQLPEQMGELEKELEGFSFSNASGEIWAERTDGVGHRSDGTPVDIVG